MFSEDARREAAGGEGDEKDFEQSQRMLASYEIMLPWQLPYWETRLLAHIVEFIRPFCYATSGHIILRKEVKAILLHSVGLQREFNRKM